MNEKSIYQTIKKPVNDQLFKDRGSKFIGDAFPVKDENDVKDQLDKIQEKHAKANHHCYAYSLGYDKAYIRYNDDGEPSNSAGKPIYGQIYGFDVTNVLIIVTRYFGGTKLGVGGLINAYKTTAKLCLNEAKIIKKEITKELEVRCDYDQMNEVLKLVKKENLSIEKQELQLKCRYVLAINVDRFQHVQQQFELLKGVTVREIQRSA